MANTDKAAPSESSQDGPEAVTLPARREPSQSPVLNPEQPYSSSSHSTTPDHAAAPAAPPSSATCSPFAIPHPKRFSAVNINKKFLQKNSSAASSVGASLAAAKTGSPTRMFSSLSYFAHLTSPTSSACPSTLFFVFQASDRKAHVNCSVVHNHCPKLVPSFLCHSTRFYHAVGFVECTTFPTSRTNPRGTSISPCWQSHTAPTKERSGVVVSAGQEGCLHKTGLGKRKVSSRHLR